ncbi:hypothetical protein RFI_21543 [Reticulomyxa filosa]|uniref:Uncharacterized protein n=1 Tax=Reticulomyxa filosa TaxID=46433 RepID=X6MRU6_RETFI|nr:hypothetical protein RFI_21543 [Reticulomyxa filosa]|eukprot:ETO15820.1 hypothetical protein RFI_21543 [Reticulomyxa filosa]
MLVSFFLFLVSVKGAHSISFYTNGDKDKNKKIGVEKRVFFQLSKKKKLTLTHRIRYLIDIFTIKYKLNTISNCIFTIYGVVLLCDRKNEYKSKLMKSDKKYLLENIFYYPYFTLMSIITTCFILCYLMTFKRNELKYKFKNDPIKIFCEKGQYAKIMKKGVHYQSPKKS